MLQLYLKAISQARKTLGAMQLLFVAVATEDPAETRAGEETENKKMRMTDKDMI